MKPREREVYREARYSEIGGQRARGGKSRRIMVEASRDELIANLPVKLLMQWFGRCAIQPDHFKSQDRMAPPLFHDRFVVRRFHFVDFVRQHDSSRKALPIANSPQSGLAISVQVDC
jgi:hypothetical protein